MAEVTGKTRLLCFFDAPITDQIQARSQLYVCRDVEPTLYYNLDMLKSLIQLKWLNDIYTMKGQYNGRTMNVYSTITGHKYLASISALSKKARQRLKWLD